jgi:AhpD family alkylhydroperoxidase
LKTRIKHFKESDTDREIVPLGLASEERLTLMASIMMVAEDEATGHVKSVYEAIRTTLNIDFVPNMYKIMATNPAYLAVTWDKIKAVMHQPGQLDTLTKDIIALTVSMMSGCDYCITVYTAAVRNLGLNDEAIVEIMAVVDLFNGLNRFNISAQVEPDEKPWFG